MNKFMRARKIRVSRRPLSSVAIAGGLIALACFGLQSADAQTYTYNNTNGYFSTGFTGKLTTGSTTANLAFGGNSYTVTDDLTNIVSLNSLQFTNTGAVTLARSGVGGASNTLNFNGPSSAIFLGNSSGAVNIALDLSLGLHGINVDGGSTAVTDTLSGSISGIGFVDFLGSTSTLALTNLNNSYSGGTVFAGGTISIAGDGSLGATRTTTGAANLDFAGGTLQFGANNIVLDANRNVTLENYSTNAIDTQNFRTTIAGAISGTGGLTVKGNGVLYLTGANTFTGTTTIAANSELDPGNFGTAGSLGTGNIVNNGTLGFSHTDGIFVPNVISGSGDVAVYTGAAELAGANTYTGRTIVEGGTLTITADNNLGAVPVSASAGGLSLGLTMPATLELEADGVELNANRSILLFGGAQTIQVDAAHKDAIDGIISLSGSLIVNSQGSGTLTLSGANTYTGGTTVTTATLDLNATAADGTGTLEIDKGSTVNLLVSNALGSGAVILNGGNLVNAYSGNSGHAGLIAASGGSGATYTGLGLLSVGTGTSIIDYGAGNIGAEFAFAGAGTFSGTLEILNWNDAPGADGGLDSLYIGTSLSGLTTAQLAEIEFVNPDGMTGTYAAEQGSDGSLFANSTPIGGAASAPEPGSVALLGIAGIPIVLGRLRRRRATIGQ